MTALDASISIHRCGIIHSTPNSPPEFLCPTSQSIGFRRPLQVSLSLFPRRNKNKNKNCYSVATTGGITATPLASAMASSLKEVLPPALDSSSEPPTIFDGTTKLYISYSCPYAQRVWITRNCKGLEDTIKLVPIDLKNRPAWYKEKVYPKNKVPSLEHNNEVKGESLDLIRYIDTNFEGPSLFPTDLAKREFGEELLAYTGPFYTAVITSLKGNTMNEANAAFDRIETALSKFDDGPFFLNQFSLVDIAYVPFIERFQAFFSEVKNCDITRGRSKLATWVQEMNKIEAYTQTKCDPKELVESYKRRFLSSL